MPNYIRWREAGATYFFTIVTLRRMPIFEQEFAREAFRTAIQLTQKTHPFEMPACVLLPDHFHCPWTMPRGDSDFPIRWRMIKSRFTRTYLHAGGEEQRTTRNAADEGRRGVLQPRYFEHRIRDERDYTVHRDYIHFNPVKHGLVATPEDWPHSTVHVHFQRGELAPDWWNGVELVLPDLPE